MKKNFKFIISFSTRNLTTKYNSKYFKHPQHDISFGRFRIKIGNLNYKYDDKSSITILSSVYDDSIPMKSNASPDLSNNPEDDTTYAGNSFTPDYTQLS